MCALMCLFLNATIRVIVLAAASKRGCRDKVAAPRLRCRSGKKQDNSVLAPDKVAAMLSRAAGGAVLRVAHMHRTDIQLASPAKPAMHKVGASRGGCRWAGGGEGGEEAKPAMLKVGVAPALFRWGPLFPCPVPHQPLLHCSPAPSPGRGHRLPLARGGAISCPLPGEGASAAA